MLSGSQARGLPCTAPSGTKDTFVSPSRTERIPAGRRSRSAQVNAELAAMSFVSSSSFPGLGRRPPDLDAGHRHVSRSAHDHDKHQARNIQALNIRA
ncbi:hypothetical protein ACFQ3Z_03155 [Streptomyces nogalater]